MAQARIILGGSHQTVGWGWMTLSRLLGIGANSGKRPRGASFTCRWWSQDGAAAPVKPLFASRDLPYRPTAPQLSARIPSPLSEEEVAQMAATLPRIRRPAPEHSAREQRADLNTDDVNSMEDCHPSSLDEEMEQALAKALARLRQMTKQGGH
jgi:hypothetical protein